MFSDSYFTVSRTGESVFKDRGSKFLGFAFPVTSEAEIRAHLLTLRKEHPSATHHCYAWVLGTMKEGWRVNDDGEPSGTAGRPIHAQIASADLTNVLVVVVRYFGGTLLGTSGLINAYRAAAAAAIEAAGIVEKHIVFEYEIGFSAEDTGGVMRLLREMQAKIVSNSYEGNSVLRFQVKKSAAHDIEHRFSHLYAVKLSFIRTI